MVPGIIIALAVLFLWVRIEPTRIGAGISWLIVWLLVASVAVAIFVAFVATARLLIH